MIGAVARAIANTVAIDMPGAEQRPPLPQSRRAAHPEIRERAHIRRETRI